MLEEKRKKVLFRLSLIYVVVVCLDSICNAIAHMVSIRITVGMSVGMSIGMAVCMTVGDTVYPICSFHGPVFIDGLFEI